MCQRRRDRRLMMIASARGSSSSSMLIPKNRPRARNVDEIWTWTTRWRAADRRRLSRRWLAGWLVDENENSICVTRLEIQYSRKVEGGAQVERGRESGRTQKSSSGSHQRAARLHWIFNYKDSKGAAALGSIDWSWPIAWRYQRPSTTTERTFKCCANNNKRQTNAGGQLELWRKLNGMDMPFRFFLSRMFRSVLGWLEMNCYFGGSTGGS